MTRHAMPNPLRVLALLVAWLAMIAPASASPAAPATPAAPPPKQVEVELRVVPFNDPATTVDKLDRSQVISEPVSTGRGVEMRRIGVDTVCWARGIQLDGKPIFERYHEGKFIARLPVARVPLTPGEHRLWPGDHVFTVNGDGTLKSSDPELSIEGTVLRIKTYPVTVQAFRANPDEADLPLSMRSSPLPGLTVREAADAATAPMDGKGKSAARDLLPVFDDFAPLTIWLPAHTAGQGYLIHPIGATFQLSAAGIAVGAGGGTKVPGLATEGSTLRLPVYAYRVGGDAGGSMVVTGVQSISAGGATNWYPRHEPYEVRVAPLGPALMIDGDLARLPIKAFQIGRGEIASDIHRGLSVELTSDRLESGKPLRARVVTVDPSPVMLADRERKRADNELTAAQKSLADLQPRIVKAIAATRPAPAPSPGVTAASTPVPSGPASPSAAGEPPGESPTATLERLRNEESLWRERTETARASVTAATDRVAQLGQTNAAADWKPFARLQRYGTSDWIDLETVPVIGAAPAAAPAVTRPAATQASAASSAAQPAATQPVTMPTFNDGLVDIRVPANLAAGIYRLEVGTAAPSHPESRIAVQSHVSVAALSPLSLGLFTLRGRDAFYRGESFWVALTALARQAPIAAGSEVQVELVDAAGRRWPLVSQRVAEAIKDRYTFIVDLPAALTLDLAPGSYTVEAKLAGAQASPLRFDLIDPEPATHFTNLLSGKYNILGSNYSMGGYSNVLVTGQGADDLAREITEAGYNAFMGMAYGFNRVNRNDLRIEQLVRDRPDLGPWESFYQPSGRDRFMSAAIRRNLRFFDDLFTYNDTLLPRGKDFLGACERFASLEAASMAYSPAYRGACLYDEIYFGSSIGVPIPVLAAITGTDETDYRAAYREQGLTTAKAAKALDRFLGRNPGQRDYADLVTFRTSGEFEDAHWANLSRRVSDALRAVAPGNRNFTLQRAWGSNGGNLAINGASSDVFASLDAASCVMYKDGGIGDRPVFPAMMADILRVRDDIPVWTQLHHFHAPGVYGDHILRGAFLALSQKTDGFSFFTIEFDPSHPNQSDSRDTIRNVARTLTTPYGDFFMATQRGYRKVAVLYSRRADLLSPRKATAVAPVSEGLWVACLRAGFPADFLYDDQLEAGRGMEYDAIFAPGFTIDQEVDPRTRKALERLVNAGKFVIVERSSKLDIEGVARLDSELDEYDDKLGGAFPRYIDLEFNMVFDQTRETTRLVKQFLTGKVTPAAEHDLLVGPDWLRAGDGRYLVVANFADTGFYGSRRTLYQAPDAPTLRLPRSMASGAVCYDMLEMKRLDTSVQGETVSVTADMRRTPGKILAFLPAAIERVELSAGLSGADLAYRVSVADAAGKAINAAFPIEVRIVDPTGKEMQRLYRAAAPEFHGAFRVPANVGAGVWRIEARELVSGRASSVSVKVDERKPTPAAMDERVVRMRQPTAVRGFVTTPGPVWIALDTEQAWIRPHAERLQRALAQRGREVKIVKATDVIRLPGRWGESGSDIDGTRLWRGDVVEPGLFIDAPLIVLGKRYESRLIEALVRRDVLAEPLTSNFPGSGRALVDVTRRAFSNEFDTLSVLATDEAGLTAGIGAIEDALKESGQPALASAATRPASDWPRGVEAVTFKAAATMQPGAAAPPATQPTIADVLSGSDWIRTLDVDAASGRTLVGTQGYCHNLFCFASDGKPVWKQFLPEHNVYVARFIDGGKKIVAATGRGYFVFILDAADGRVIQRISATEWPDYHQGYLEGPQDTQCPVIINTPLRQVIVVGRTRVLAIDFDGKKQWLRDRAEAVTAYPPETEQTHAAAFGCSLVLSELAVSPDGLRLVHGEYRLAGSAKSKMPGELIQVWQFVPIVLDARTGEVTGEWIGDPGSRSSPDGWSVRWPRDSQTPVVHFNGRVASLTFNGQLGPWTPAPRNLRSDGSEIRRDAAGVHLLDSTGRLRWKRATPGAISELDTFSPDNARLYRCDRDGLVTCINTTDGAVVWTYRTPFSSMMQTIGDGLVCGDKSGRVVRLNADGKVVWAARLGDLFEPPGRDYSAYVRAAVARDADGTAQLLSVNEDHAGDYDKVLRFGVEQLVNPGFESRDGWIAKSGSLTAAAPAHGGGASLVLESGQLVTQAIARRIVPSATYLLEFYYRTENPGSTLIAGAELRGAGKPIFTASVSRAVTGNPGDWRFARLAIKSLATTQSLEIGFEAAGGRVWVDDVSLRAVRFPSANLLANPELQAVEPTFVRDIRVQYDRIPTSLRETLMRRNRVAAFKQGGANTATIYTQEEAMLHNGRLDDVGSFWAYPADPMGFSVVLTQPARVSHIVLYLNNAEPDNAYRTISVLANNLQTKLPEQVALVRNNRRRFVVIHFPKPVATDSIKILPLHPAHQESLTEVELYGPLGDTDLAGGASIDPDGVPMLMGRGTRVPASQPADLVGAYEVAARFDTPPAFACGAAVVDGEWAVGTSGGSLRAINLGAKDAIVKPGATKPPIAWGRTWGLQTVPATSYPARYQGRLLVGAADYRLHAVADSGAYLWGFLTGGRVHSSPLPDGDDVYVGSDDGKLYKLDVHSGTLLWEVATGGPVRSSPALSDGRVAVASCDGNLYAVDAQGGAVIWKSPIAPQTRATPVIHQGRAYLGDESGKMRCFDWASGKQAWESPLNGYISSAAVVQNDGACFISEQGEAALVAPDGAVKWKRALGVKVTSQPVGTATQVVVPTANGVRVLRRRDGADDDRYQGPADLRAKALTVLVYRDMILMTTGSGWTDLRSPPRTYAQYGGESIVLRPKATTGGGK